MRKFPNITRALRAARPTWARVFRDSLIKYGKIATGKTRKSIRTKTLRGGDSIIVR